MAFEEGYMGHEYLTRPANTFQPRTQHINQGSRAIEARRTSIKFGMFLPSASRRAPSAALTMLACATGQRILDRRIWKSSSAANAGGQPQHLRKPLLRHGA